MAKLGSIEIANRSAPHKSGAALLLNNTPSQDKIIQSDSDWEVEIESNNPYVVARTEKQLTLENVLSNSHEAIQKALDKLCIQGDGDYYCRDIDFERIIWWQEEGEQHIRIIGISELPVSMSVTATTVTSSEESNCQQSPQTEWQESQRYFRLAQASDSLFNAYRNMFLAFENILSYRTPPESGEGEREWLIRALEEANNDIDLSEFAPNDSEVVDSILQQQYYNTRVKIFHAKLTRTRLFPQNKTDRNQVQEALENLSQLVLYLIRNSISVNRSSGAMTYYGFDKMMSWIEENSNAQVVLSEDPSPLKKDESLNDSAWENRTDIPAQYSQNLSEPGLKSVLAKVNVSDLRDGLNIRRLGLVRKTSDSHNKLISVEPLGEKITLEGIDYFESQLGITLKNLESIKTRFPS